MVPIGDDQFLVRHLALDRRDSRRIGNLPYPVPDPILIVHVNNRFLPGVERLLDFALRVGVEHENVPEMRPRRS